MEGTQINHRLSSTGSDGGKPCKDGKRRYKYLPYEKPTQWTRCLSGCKKGCVRPTGYRMCEKKGKDTEGSKEVRHLNGGWLTASHIEFICEKWFKDRKFTSVYRATPYLEALAEKKGTRLNRTHSLSDQLAKKAKISSKVVFCIVNSGNSHWVVTAHTPTGHKFAWDSLKQQGKLSLRNCDDESQWCPNMYDTHAIIEQKKADTASTGYSLQNTPTTVCADVLRHSDANQVGHVNCAFRGNSWVC